jgi:hypothetical protein
MSFSLTDLLLCYYDYCFDSFWDSRARFAVLSLFMSLTDSLYFIPPMDSLLRISLVELCLLIFADGGADCLFLLSTAEESPWTEFLFIDSCLIESYCLTDSAFEDSLGVGSLMDSLLAMLGSDLVSLTDLLSLTVS